LLVACVVGLVVCVVGLRLRFGFVLCFSLRLRLSVCAALVIGSRGREDYRLLGAVSTGLLVLAFLVVLPFLVVALPFLVVVLPFLVVALLGVRPPACGLLVVAFLVVALLGFRPAARRMLGLVFLVVALLGLRLDDGTISPDHGAIGLDLGAVRVFGAEVSR